jgi:hypothetical protein
MESLQIRREGRFKWSMDARAAVFIEEAVFSCLGLVLAFSALAVCGATCAASLEQTANAIGSSSVEASLLDARAACLLLACLLLVLQVRGVAAPGLANLLVVFIRDHQADIIAPSAARSWI